MKSSKVSHKFISVIPLHSRDKEKEWGEKSLEVWGGGVFGGSGVLAIWENMRKKEKEVDLSLGLKYWIKWGAERGFPGVIMTEHTLIFPHHFLSSLSNCVSNVLAVKWKPAKKHFPLLIM